jgi:Mce-associated membrane protein
MRWPKSRRAGEVTDNDLAQGIAVESVQTTDAKDQTETTEAASRVEASVHNSQSVSVRRGSRWSRAIAYGVLPGLALSGALAAGFFKWHDGSARDGALARSESVRAATDSTLAMLSYKPDTIERDLGSAGDRLTGHFRDSYASLVNEVVIPGAKQKHISAVATVPAAASVSATGNHAVVLVFVNQTTAIGDDPPTNSASSVRVTLDKIGQRWLISDFSPV